MGLFIVDLGNRSPKNLLSFDSSEETEIIPYLLLTTCKWCHKILCLFPLFYPSSFFENIKSNGNRSLLFLVVKPICVQDSNGTIMVMQSKRQRNL